MKIISVRYGWLGLLILITLLTRLLVINGNYQGYSWDSGNFALAADNYSLQDGRPHLPGYYLHVQYISLLSKLSADHQVSMLLLSLLYSVLATLFIFLLCQKWFDLQDTVLLTLFISSNPLVLFYGSLSEIYIFDLFLSSALVYFGISPFGILFTPLLLAMGTGIRPSSGFLLMPVYIYLWTYHLHNRAVSIRTALTYHLPALIVILLWFVPMVVSTGGMTNYISLYSTHNPVEPITLWQNLFRLSSYLIYIMPAVVVFLCAYFIDRYRSVISIQSISGNVREIVCILAWWLIPSLIFFLFVHYSKGYILLCLIPIMIIMFFVINDRIIRQQSMILATVVQLLIFFSYPYSPADIQVYFNKEQRSLNITQLWFERTGSEYLMSASHICALQKNTEIIEEGIQLIDNDLNVSDSAKKYLFVDPTAIVSTRALQAAYPQIKFTKFLYRSPDQFGFHQGLVQEARRKPGQMLEKAIIISRRDFVSKHLDDLKIDLLESNETWALYIVEGADARQLFLRYATLFGRYDN